MNNVSVSKSRARRRPAAWTALAPIVIISQLGCGGGESGEVEIVVPNASVPTLNPDPKAPMANVNVENEAQHVNEMRQAGALVK